MRNKCILKLVQSKSHDPWYNLALEEYLFQHTADGEVTLYLWQNERTVVIGRNQNPWRECRFHELENDRGKLARRLSGGGAVYHDLGNLNFTFIAKKELFHIKKQLQVIMDAVTSFAIEAEFSGRNDILVKGKKFSGNAFYYDGDHCYHHGTLLVSSDLTKLVRYLRVNKEKIESKGIKSVESRVANLSRINPDINISDLRKALERSFQVVYGNTISETTIFDGDISDFTKLYQKYASWEWRYGETPHFQIRFYHRFLWGDLDINLNLADGFISEAAVYSDSLDSRLIMDLAAALQNIRFDKDALGKGANSLKKSHDRSVIEEIELWLDELEI